MLPAKKTPLPPIRTEGIRDELKHLYARRMAIDTLIESLVYYDRCREKAPETRKRRTA